MLPHKVATVMSITQWLRRMHNAQGRHIFATCEEVGGGVFCHILKFKKCLYISRWHWVFVTPGVWVLTFFICLCVMDGGVELFYANII